MDWGIFWTAAGSLATGAGVVWAVFVYVQDVRDKARQRLIDELLSKADSHMQDVRNMIQGLKFKSEEMQKEFLRQAQELFAYRKKSEEVNKSFNEYVKVMNAKVLLHETELKKMVESLGKVILK